MAGKINTELSGSLREAAIASLSEPAARLMEKIEEFSGLKLGFAPYNFPPRPNSIKPYSPATSVSHDRAIIYLHGTEPEHLFGITHELLHVHRYWLENIPQLHPIKNITSNVQACSDIENTLEHLIIVPREKDYGLDTDAHWQAVARSKWERYPWPDITDVNARRKNALMGRIEIDLSPNEEIAALADAGLRAEGLKVEAELFAAKIKQLSGNKARCLACAVRFLKWPKEKLALVYLDVRSRSRRAEPLRDH